ncbi:phage terminase large subunit-like protein [Croceifilum oryzae]|uniref:Phage terminase large subunit-like protein n=1 Tax=Croceifilum oryzae TaxID=1553429 RepID=A0AAJ1WT23_9BACL|nr:hypothetical protein [Croceifilum oryzae]MDQ0417583.1 phage terminase large subunit-like protein [Croceifilum oryzae]
MALVASTPADARDVMIQGESGILTISLPLSGSIRRKDGIY